MIINTLKSKFLLNSLYNVSIRTRLLIYFLLLVLLPTGIITITAYNISSRIITQRINTSLENDMNTVEANIIKEFQTIDDLSSYIYLNPNLTYILSDTPDSIKAQIFPKSSADIISELSILNKVLENYDFSNLNTTNITPKIYMRDKPEYNSYSFSDKVFDLGRIDTQQWYLSLPYRFKYSVVGLNKIKEDSGHKYTILLAKKLYALKDINISYAGLLTIDIGLDDFNAILENIKPTPDSVTYVIDNNRNINICSDSSALGKNINDIIPAFSSVDLLNEKYGSFNSSINNEAYFIAHKKIESIGWSIINISPRNKLYGILDTFKAVMYMGFFIFFIIGILMSLFLSENIAYPIRRLAKSMNNVQNGNFDNTLDYKRNDEFSYLVDTYNLMIRKIKELIDKLYVSELNKKEAELKSLQAQINPHFLYNTLDSVNWLAIRNNVPDISKMVTSLSDFFRYSLSKGRNIISIADELNQVNSYLSIQQIRFKDKLDFSFDISHEVRNYLTIKLILQPIVENSIIHGIEKTGLKGNIIIKADKKEDLIVISVIDNGAGADIEELNALLEETTRPSKSYGIKNVNDRIKHTFGPDYGIQFIKNEGPGLTVTITFPATNSLDQK
ncbi:sensor histidine kinase [Ruminiclostridium cellobioparum]|uniref:Multi-sensor signal transduction histidine kinase n=1 Tax=Ruminiclostridium cellobioparum subsp. termitidis CT1112 TaxID=1195236 RepID=S0FK19_RUMCE|nr:sensor histidine kinase [Ruminiclostridium cellobioparum]EMS70661.1 multi-sensor signal transduction histidine kinase [Ruminiclostridium cellobioparum subsp. termitidis CT1112]